MHMANKASRTNTWMLCNFVSLHHSVSADLSCYNHSAPFEYDAPVTDTVDEGETCLDWRHFDNYEARWSPDTFPETTAAESANYCRNPDNHEYGPWCFTSLTGGYSFCWVPWCSHAGKWNFTRLADPPCLLVTYGVYHTLFLDHCIFYHSKGSIHGRHV